MAQDFDARAYAYGVLNGILINKTRERRCGRRASELDSGQIRAARELRAISFLDGAGLASILQ